MWTTAVSDLLKKKRLEHFKFWKLKEKKKKLVLLLCVVKHEKKTLDVATSLENSLEKTEHRNPIEKVSFCQTGIFLPCLFLFCLFVVCSVLVNLLSVSTIPEKKVFVGRNKNKIKPITSNWLTSLEHLLAPNSHQLFPHIVCILFLLTSSTTSLVLIIETQKKT